MCVCARARACSSFCCMFTQSNNNSIGEHLNEYSTSLLYDVSGEFCGSDVQLACSYLHSGCACDCACDCVRVCVCACAYVRETILKHSLFLCNLYMCLNNAYRFKHKCVRMRVCSHTQ